MLPSGGRCTDQPRVAMQAMSNRAPSHDSEMPMPAHCRFCGTSGASVSTFVTTAMSPPASATSCVSPARRAAARA